MSENPFDPSSLDDLPSVLPVFPLGGATLLPGTQLPLNIFEPRYLNMVLDALGGARYVGMLQPDPRRRGEQPEAVYGIGCAGRIVAFNESGDGRLLISLQGVCRFRVGRELELLRGYRRIEPDWRPFAADLTPDDGFSLDRESLRASLVGYLDESSIRVDWDALEKMPDHRVVDFLAMHLPFSPEEKQALIEAPDADARVQTLVAVGQLAARDDDAGVRH